jgi:hypothetical protein
MDAETTPDQDKVSPWSTKKKIARAKTQQTRHCPAGLSGKSGGVTNPSTRNDGKQNSRNENC